MAARGAGMAATGIVLAAAGIVGSEVGGLVLSLILLPIGAVVALVGLYRLLSGPGGAGGRLAPGLLVVGTGAMLTGAVLAVLVGVTAGWMIAMAGIAGVVTGGIGLAVGARPTVADRLRAARGRDEGGGHDPFPVSSTPDHGSFAASGDDDRRRDAAVSWSSVTESSSHSGGSSSSDSGDSSSSSDGGSSGSSD